MFLFKLSSESLFGYKTAPFWTTLGVILEQVWRKNVFFEVPFFDDFLEGPLDRIFSEKGGYVGAGNGFEGPGEG